MMKKFLFLALLSPVLVLSECYARSPQAGHGKTRELVNSGALQITVPDILDASALRDGSDGTPAVDPCDNFYHFACGRWIENTVIPADKDRVMHQSTALVDQTDAKLNQLILRIQQGKLGSQVPAARQLSEYYQSCMNMEKSFAQEQPVLRDLLKQVEDLKHKEDLAALLAQLQLKGVRALFSFHSGQDLKDSNSVIGYFDQDGMALAEPSFYLEQDAKSREIRQKYLAHIAKSLELSQLSNSQDSAVGTDASAAAVALAIETRLARKAMTFDDRQNPAKINHPVTLDSLGRVAPAVDWAIYLRVLGAPKSALNLNAPEYFKRLSQVVSTTSLRDLKTYLRWQIVHRSAELVSPQLEREDFNFWRRYLKGAKEMKPRWKICTEAVERNLGYALAEAYVQTIDAGAIRVQIDTMIKGIKQVFREDLEALTTGPNAWLDAATRDEAILKLTRLSQKLGAPEKWRDYKALQLQPESYLASDIKATEFENKRDLAKIGQPLDRLEWDMMPWEVNAYYDPPKNEFVFPFGILQPPSFDLKASEGANLGAFGGGTIGHELTHGFDSDGRQYDSQGNIREWWTPDTLKSFNNHAQCFINQANSYKIEEVALNVDGTKTLTENLADQGGVKLGYAALMKSLANRAPAAPWLGRYSENQQYWISYAQSWCGKANPEALRQQIKTDPHPPEEFRVNGVLMNRPEFARDFSCREGLRMTPKVRCSLW